MSAGEDEPVTEDVLLRSATRRDRETIHRMSLDLLEEHRLTYGSDVVRGRRTERYVSKLVGSHIRKGAVIVAERGGQVVGFVLLSQARFTLGTVRPTGSITDIYVVPDERGRGVGGRMLTAGLAWLRSQGYQRVVLNVAAGNAARNLYERMGFTTFSESMELDLDPPRP